MKTRSEIQTDFDVQLLFDWINGALTPDHSAEGRKTWRLDVATAAWWARLSRVKRRGSQLLLGTAPQEQSRYEIYRETDVQAAVSTERRRFLAGNQRHGQPDDGSSRVFWLVEREKSPEGGTFETSRRTELPPELMTARSDPEDKGVRAPAFTPGNMLDEIGFLHSGLRKIERAGFLFRLVCCPRCAHFFIRNGRGVFCSPQCKDAGRVPKQRSRAEYMRKYRKTKDQLRRGKVRARLRAIGVTSRYKTNRAR